jgi:AcrR family transcriptional regulator
MAQKPNRRDDVKNAALLILERDGAQGLRTAAIAREVGFSEAALYCYFPGKDAILEFILDERLAVTRGNRLAVDALGLPPLDSVLALFARHMEFMEKNPGLYRVIYSDELHRGSPALMKKLRRVSREHLDAVCAYTRAAHRAGQLRPDVDPDSLGMALMGAVHSAFAARTVIGKRKKMSAMGADMLRLILRGATA